jgi:hypothetical protein
MKKNKLLLFLFIFRISSTFAESASSITKEADLLKEQQPSSNKQLLLDSMQKFSSNIDDNRCSCGNLPHELCARPDCIKKIGINNNNLL